MKRTIGKEILSLLKETFVGWHNDDASQLAAGLAFYAVCSAAPLLVIVIAIASLFFGQEAAGGQAASQLESIVGAPGAQVFQTILSQARRRSHLATFIGILTMFFAAAAVFANLHSALNKIWGVTSKSGKVLWPFIRKRLLSISMVIGSGFVLLLSLIAIAGLSTAARRGPGSLPIPAYMLHAADFLIIFGLFMLVFGIIYKVLPDVRLAWSDVWIGAAVTSLLFAMGKSLIGLYLAHSGLGSFYGAAGSVVMFLVWIYYSAQVFFLGAEFTHSYVRRYGSMKGKS
jgi:membrane protein